MTAPSIKLLTFAIDALEYALEAIREAENLTYINLEPTREKTESALSLVWSALEKERDTTYRLSQ
jgi:hypothetical protein